MPTTVVNRKHTQIYDVYIGRPSKWGNPYKMGPGMTRAQAIAAYETWILCNPILRSDLHELRGKILACWCHPLPCHGDVLARLADAETWNTCPDCGVRWQDLEPTIGLLHRTRLCGACKDVEARGETF